MAVGFTSHCTRWEFVAVTIIVAVLLHYDCLRTKVSCASIPSHVPLQEKHHHLISKLSHYELVRPYRSTSDGNFVTHDLSTSQEEERNVYERAKRDTLHNNQYGGRGSRHARSTSHRIAGGDSHDDGLTQNHHFRVDAFGARLTLNVTRNRFLVTPKMKVEWYHEDGTKEVYRPNTLCYYTGSVNDMSRSSVAISNCDGLSGLIRAGAEEYIIEPLESVVGKSRVNISEGHLHIMYRPRDFKMESTQLHTDLTRDLHHDTPEENRSGRPQDRGFAETFHRERRRAGDPGQKHFVETMMAADKSMTSFHEAEHMTTYLLTMLNIVNVAYRHDSMPFDIQFSASRIILLDERMSSNMVVQHQAQASLSNVCRWATRQTVRDDTQENHHDLAIFGTRLDFGPAGYAPVTGMCAMTRSCALIRDEGLLSSFVMAHEAGHVFGMEHDGAGNTCTAEPYQGSIMAPVVISTYTEHFWSDCSIEELSRYLGNYDCLEDSPFETTLPELEGYPGEWYSMDDQCRFDFGKDFVLCGGPEDDKSCSQLWCLDPWDPQYCRTKKGPPLDGTECGYDKWCIQGSCVYKDAGRQNGEWSKFSPWSDCSYPCGIGVQVRKRECNNPPPSHGGNDCKGEPYDYRLCNKRDCVGEWEDRRAKQCEENLASFQLGGRQHKWLPHENRNRTLQCRLTCISETSDDVVVTDYNVTDGTPCSYDDHYSVCIQGKCVNLGCDKQIDSSKVEDKCGVCDGDNSQCTIVQRNFVQEPKKKYQVIHTLPAASRNIDVRENTHTNSFIALRRPEEKIYILNPRGTQSGPHSFIGGGARFIYSPNTERLFTLGPIHEELDLLVFWTKNSKPVNITYSYYLNDDRSQTEPTTGTKTQGVPMDTDEPEEPGPDPTEGQDVPEYMWLDEGWTDCTKTCGGGFSFHIFRCYRTSDNLRVKKTLCGHGNYNPKDTKQACNEQPCGTITKAATSKPTTVPSTSRTTAAPPTTTQRLTTKQATTMPQTTTRRPTTQATTTTQPATTTQTTTTTQPMTTTQATTTPQPTTTMTTTAATTTLPPITTTRLTTRAPAPTTPKTTKKTKGKKKPIFNWKAQEWQPCSHDCGTEGTQTRVVTCSKKLGKKISTALEYKCKEERPSDTQPCNREPCTAHWSIGEWSSCTVTCGEGFKSRDVMCGAPNSEPGEFQCIDEEPATTTTCNMGDCPEETGCEPMQSIICQKDQYRTYCMMPSYETICCTTCEEQENQEEQEEQENQVNEPNGKKKKKKKKKGGRGRTGRGQ